PDSPHFSESARACRSHSSWGRLSQHCVAPAGRSLRDKLLSLEYLNCTLLVEHRSSIWDMQRIPNRTEKVSLPRQADPQLEQRILDAACRLWSRGGEKSLTIRGVAKAAGTTTPTLYERYQDRDDILRAVRIQTRLELFAALRRTRSLAQACQRYLEFAQEHRHA